VLPNLPANAAEKRLREANILGGHNTFMILLKQVYVPVSSCAAGSRMFNGR
jgi:hypothetical protein